MALRPIPLAAGGYELTSRAASAARLVNLFAEPLPEGARSKFILKGTPGLSRFCTVGNGPVQAMAAMPGLLYVVSGNWFYRVRPDGTSDTLGHVGTPALAPSIAIGADEVVVCAPPRAFVADHAGAMSEITTGSGNFPAEGASSVCTIDGYFVFTNFTGEYFFVSKLLDGGSFDSLDYATSERRPDFVKKAIAHNGELWLWGQDASAVWYNAGAADFPFRERAGSVLDQGLASAATLAVLDNSLFWLSSDRAVYRTSGYRAVRVSDHAIEEVLARVADLATVTGCAWLWEGHAFYALSLADRTWVYDGASQLWHELRTGESGRWRVNVAEQFERRVLLGDSYTGDLWNVSAVSTEDQAGPISRVAVLPPLVTHGPLASMSRLEVEMEVGTEGAPGVVLLDWSDDGGVTYRAARALSTGAIGATRQRVATTRLGSFRQRVLRLSATGPLTVYGVDADVGAVG